MQKERKFVVALALALVGCVESTSHRTGDTGQAPAVDGGVDSAVLDDGVPDTVAADQHPFDSDAHEAGADAGADGGVKPDTGPDDGIPDPLLPFDQPSIGQLQASPRKVVAHWHQVPLSDDNGMPPGDKQTQYMYKNLVLRHRPVRFLPLRRPTRPGLSTEAWRVADAASEIQLARAVGIDVFMVNFGALDTKNWRGLPHYIRMLKAAKQLKNGFSVAPNLDCAGGSSSAAQGTTSAKNVLTFLKDAGELKNPNMFRIGGKMVVGTWKYEACSVGFWKAVRDTFAKDGIAVHLMCIAHTKPALASHDGVCDSWGDWGPRTYNASFGANISKLTNQSNEPRVAAIPTMFTHHNQTDGDGWEPRATQLMRGVWTEAIKAKVEHAQIVTWNDCMEGSAFVPGTGRQFAVYDMAAYYITWFKTGSAPKIVRDALYYMHRKHPVPKSSAVSWHGPGPTNEIELVGFLTAPGTLEIVTSKGTTQKAVPAGVQAIYAPMPAAGKPRFRLVRAGKAVVDIQSQFAVSAWDASFQDAQYRGGGSRRTLHAGAASAGATCAKRGVEACLSPGLGEPVWLAF